MTASTPPLDASFDSFDPLDLPAVEAAITHTSFHGHLHHLASTPSTQTLALQAARAGVQHGVWIADEQTAGRGRGAHTWHSPAGAGLLLSALVTPPIPLAAANHLSLRVALACQAAIAEVTGFAPRSEIDIRWPNDLLLRGPHSPAHSGNARPFRKVGGILIESAATPAPEPTLRYAVLGIGLNVNHTHFPPDLDPLATSLRRESPDPTTRISREHLLAALLHHLDHHLTTPLPHDLTPVSSWLTGKRVTIPADPLLPDSPLNQPTTGTTAGLTPEGFLRVLADDGTTRIVRSGGVREPDSLQIAATPTSPDQNQLQTPPEAP